MKCIARMYGLSGGAPRSLLQHLKVLRRMGYDNIICFAHNSDDKVYQEYLQAGCTFVQRKSCSEFWDSSEYWKMYMELVWEYKYIRKEKPDIVIALGEINGAFYSQICSKLGVRLLIYIPGGQITNRSAMKLWRNCEVVCFSQENQEEICKYYEREKVHLISNRIDIKERFSDAATHYCQKQAPINIVIPSRIASDKVRSIKSTIQVLSECADDDLPLNVHIAGKGKELNELKHFCDNVMNRNISISLLGHIDNLTEEFRWAHIVAGKGRSVIEPIMMNRVGCVIGEDGSLAFCTMNNYLELYYYNFSGRNLPKAEPMELMRNMLDRIHKGAIRRDELVETANVVSQLYSAAYLLEQVKKVLSNANKRKPILPVGFIWMQFIRFAAGKIMDKVVH